MSAPRILGTLDEGGWAATLVLFGPFAKRGVEHARDLLFVERLAQHIESSQVQYFGPEEIVRKLGSHDQPGRARQRRDLRKHILPTRVAERPRTDNDGDSMML